jgi:hypothetical protein
MELEFSRKIFDKLSNIKITENPLCGNLVVACGQTDRQKYVKKLKVAFRNFSNASKRKQERKFHTYTHPHITKPTHTHPNITKPTHTHTHTIQNPHIHPHITKPTHYKTS